MKRSVWPLALSTRIAEIKRQFATRFLMCFRPMNLMQEKARTGISPGALSLAASFQIFGLTARYDGRDQSMIDALLSRMVAEDKEGLMANLDVPYKRKRHSGILKIKRFYTMDLPVIACEEGSGRLAGVLGAFVLGYKGNEVRVGSGFTDEQRVTYWNHRNELPGILCEVKYKEVSYDKHTGAESLQFPVFVQLRTDKNDVSYG